MYFVDTVGEGRQGLGLLQGLPLLEVASDGNKCSRPKDQVGGGAARDSEQEAYIPWRGVPDQASLSPMGPQLCRQSNR